VSLLADLARLLDEADSRARGAIERNRYATADFQTGRSLGIREVVDLLGIDQDALEAEMDRQKGKP
jgi:hypothetical protein